MLLLKHFEIGLDGSTHYYLGHFLFRSKEVVVGEINHIWACDNGQSFSQMVTVWEVHVEHVADLGVLWISRRSRL